jgi:hypothetical protein
MKMNRLKILPDGIIVSIFNMVMGPPCLTTSVTDLFRVIVDLYPERMDALQFLKNLDQKILRSFVTVNFTTNFEIFLRSKVHMPLELLARQFANAPFTCVSGSSIIPFIFGPQPWTPNDLDIFIYCQENIDNYFIDGLVDVFQRSEGHLYPDPTTNSHWYKNLSGIRGVTTLEFFDFKVQFISTTKRGAVEVVNGFDLNAVRVGFSLDMTASATNSFWDYVWQIDIGDDLIFPDLLLEIFLKEISINQLWVKSMKQDAPDEFLLVGSSFPLTLRTLAKKKEILSQINLTVDRMLKVCYTAWSICLYFNYLPYVSQYLVHCSSRVPNYW